MASGNPQVDTQLLWLDLTRKCQLSCTHCYNASGPGGGHGNMTQAHWTSVLDQATECGVRSIQFIGGEPTMHPAFTALLDHALTVGLDVEVYSNLVHVSDECWSLFQHESLSLATSYYSGRAGQHDAVTGRRSHGRTRANIERAVALGIPLRVGVIEATGSVDTDVSLALSDLTAMGVKRVGVDHVRPFGRGSKGRTPDLAGLCGRCGIGRAVVGPSGDVAPCVFSEWMSIGNVMTTALADILGSTEMHRANARIRASVMSRPNSSDEDCFPTAPEPCSPLDPAPCGPNDDECRPGTPGTDCSPRR